MKATPTRVKRLLSQVQNILDEVAKIDDRRVKNISAPLCKVEAYLKRWLQSQER